MLQRTFQKIKMQHETSRRNFQSSKVCILGQTRSGSMPVDDRMLDGRVVSTMLSSCYRAVLIVVVNFCSSIITVC